MNQADYDRAFRLLTGCVNARDYEEQKDRIWIQKPKPNPAKRKCGRPSFEIPRHMRDTYLSAKQPGTLLGDGEL